MWLQARQEDKIKASALESKAEENAQKILEAVEQVAEAAPSDGSEVPAEEITEDKVEEILKDNLAVNPDAGLGKFSNSDHLMALSKCAEFENNYFHNHSKYLRRVSFWMVN